MLNLEKYKAVQKFPMQEDRNRRIAIFWSFYFLEQNYCEFLNSKVGLNILPISIVCHNHSC